ncbi:signal-regulatory protein gamma-like isoform X1 [Hemicordylus capensis]|uniref:signal-regulatory protein gamma-like isoform X1 n=1 Tax=Hemicordylus capensis TaxID=884348 RepID=UPI0023041797|nr:signal-regulatory protein gamma-like isoform X1 [Hemicordylus capensis]
MTFNMTLLALFLKVLVSPALAGGRGAESQEQQVLQPQNFVSVLRGQDLKLECHVSGTFPPGPVRWFMGQGLTRRLIYTESKTDERITRSIENSDMDFTIVIHNIILEDAGTYYCVKQKTVPGKDPKDCKSGHGTVVAVKTFQDIIIPAAAGTLSVLVAALFFAAVYFYTKKKRGMNQCTSSLKAPLPENERPPKQTLPDKEVVYADVKLSVPSNPQKPKQSNPEEHSAYATIRVAQPATG